MRSRLVAVLAVTALFVTGCESVQDAAGDAASQFARDVATDQLCRFAGDGPMEADELERLDELVEAGERAGVPDEVLEPARVLVDQAQSAGNDAVEHMRTACIDAGVDISATQDAASEGS